MVLKRKGDKLVYAGLPTAAKEALKVAADFNKVMADMNREVDKRLRERDIERHLVQRVKALGGEVRKVSWVGRRGAPDRLVMLPERQGPLRSRVEFGLRKVWRPKIAALSCWVELKAPGVKPEAYQLREHERMRAMGQRVVVIDSIEGVGELLS